MAQRVALWAFFEGGGDTENSDIKYEDSEVKRGVYIIQEREGLVSPPSRECGLDEILQVTAAKILG